LTVGCTVPAAAGAVVGLAAAAVVGAAVGCAAGAVVADGAAAGPHAARRRLAARTSDRPGDSFMSNAPFKDRSAIS
jgi:hypothetical protein